MADQNNEDSTIRLSHMSQALIDSLGQAYKKKEAPLEGESYEVSDTVSFFGFMYEKLRNAVEFNEEHLVRRMAIARILKRRLAINPKGKGEGENLVRELLWGKYMSNESISHKDVFTLELIVQRYLLFMHKIKETHQVKSSESLGDTILDLMSCEIEETLSKKESHKNAAYLYFFYQTLRNKVEIKEISEEDKDTFFYAAAEEAFSKNDTPFIRYHLFTLNFGPLHKLSKEQIYKVAAGFHVYAKEFENILKNPYKDKLVKFAKKQVAPFKILYDILEKSGSDLNSIVTSTKALKGKVEEVCSVKYQQTNEKLKSAAIRSIIYIFLTKMVFVILFELPLSKLLFNEIHIAPLGINTVFPPLLMGVIVTFINPPSSRNTQRIYGRIVDILNREPSFETSKTLISRKGRAQNPILLFVFTILYLITFSLIFGGLYIGLEMLGFNILSKGVFFFFISVVAFFGYRIRQTAKEYVLESEKNIFISFATFLFLPILYVGKILSNEISKINLFILLFDTIIEAPFKFFIEGLEEWSRFVKARKDELI